MQQLSHLPCRCLRVVPMLLRVEMFSSEDEFSATFGLFHILSSPSSSFKYCPPPLRPPTPRPQDCHYSEPVEIEPPPSHQSSPASMPILQPPATETESYSDELTFSKMSMACYNLKCSSLNEHLCFNIGLQHLIQRSE